MTLLRTENLCKHYSIAQGKTLHALQNVSLHVADGEVLGVVGESGCGKSTLGRTLLRLTEPSSGSIEFAGNDILSFSKQQMNAFRRDCQIIFQDPYGALNPRHKVSHILSEPLIVHKSGSSGEREQRVNELLSLVGLPTAAVSRYPHEFSGGQRQRIAIARALTLRPKFIVADEPVSALDVSIQSQIINLIMALRKKLALSLLFISHDLSVIRHVSDRVAVMYLGRIVETGISEEVFQQPAHPYTQALLSAIPSAAIPVTVNAPVANQHAGRIILPRIILQGELPDPTKPPVGCAFESRCSHAKSVCKTVQPTLIKRSLVPLSSGAEKHTVENALPLSNSPLLREAACHLYPEAKI